jgi:hypothetical protein
MYVPDAVLTNADFERMVDTSDEWIRERTGIRERRIAGFRRLVGAFLQPLPYRGGCADAEPLQDIQRVAAGRGIGLGDLILDVANQAVATAP